MATDHKPLMYLCLLTPWDANLPYLPPKQLIQLLDYVSQFTTNRNVYGSNNFAVDTLSWNMPNGPQTDKPPVINFKEMAMAQQLDTELLKLQSSPACLHLQGHSHAHICPHHHL